MIIFMNVYFLGIGAGDLNIKAECRLLSEIYEVTDCSTIETIPNGALSKGTITHQNLGNSTIELSNEWATVGTHSIKTTLKLSGWSSYRVINFATISKKGRVILDYNITNSIRLFVGMRIAGSERFTPPVTYDGTGTGTIDYDFTQYDGEIQRFEIRMNLQRTTDTVSTAYIDNIRVYPV